MELVSSSTVVVKPVPAPVLPPFPNRYIRELDVKCDPSGWSAKIKAQAYNYARDMLAPETAPGAVQEHTIDNLKAEMARVPALAFIIAGGPVPAGVTTIPGLATVCNLLISEKDLLKQQTDAQAAIGVAQALPDTDTTKAAKVAAAQLAYSNVVNDLNKVKAALWMA